MLSYFFTLRATLYLSNVLTRLKSGCNDLVLPIIASRTRRETSLDNSKFASSKLSSSIEAESSLPFEGTRASASFPPHFSGRWHVRKDAIRGIVAWLPGCATIIGKGNRHISRVPCFCARAFLYASVRARELVSQPGARCAATLHSLPLFRF